MTGGFTNPRSDLSPVASAVGTLPASRSDLTPKVVSGLSKPRCKWDLNVSSVQVPGEWCTCGPAVLRVSRASPVTSAWNTPEVGLTTGTQVEWEVCQIGSKDLQPPIRNWNSSHSMASPGFCHDCTSVPWAGLPDRYLKLIKPPGLWWCFKWHHFVLFKLLTGQDAQSLNVF